MQQIIIKIPTDNDIFIGYFNFIDSLSQFFQKNIILDFPGMSVVATNQNIRF